MPRPTCPDCRLPLATCLCRWVTPTHNELPLLVLQHPQEATQAKGSARLLGLSLRHSRCLVPSDMTEPELAGLLGADGDSLLLFPAAPAGDSPAAGPPQPAATETAGTQPLRPCPRQLVLLDGTWRQARQLLRAHACLQELPRWALPALPPSRYAIRRAPRPGQQRSTLEAACLALGLLEQRPAHYDPLLTAFSGWVAEVAARATPAPTPVCP